MYIVLLCECTQVRSTVVHEHSSLGESFNLIYRDITMRNYTDEELEAGMDYQDEQNFYPDPEEDQKPLTGLNINNI